MGPNPIIGFLILKKRENVDMDAEVRMPCEHKENTG